MQRGMPWRAWPFTILLLLSLSETERFLACQYLNHTTAGLTKNRWTVQYENTARVLQAVT